MSVAGLNFDCIVIGAGPAGIIAAGMAAGQGARTAILERNDLIGKKLLLTGGGRCNISNLLSPNEFFKAFGREGQFLRPALAAFGPEQLTAFLADLGVSLRQEDQMLFVNGGSRALVEGLTQFLHRRQVKTLFDQRVLNIRTAEDGTLEIQTETDSFTALKKVVITTGGKSYPNTGSTGDGLKWARELGHQIITPVPAMGTVFVQEPIFAGLSGISLSDIQLEVLADGKRQGTFTGDFLITHHGISGPVVLNSSLTVARCLQRHKNVQIQIDFFPSVKEIDLETVPPLPHRLEETFLKYVGVDIENKTLQISRTKRHQLSQILKSLKLTVTGTGSWEQGMVTVGGIALNEVNPHTMESRIVKGLYFAGEVLDLAATCGGFNLQAAFATGYLAGIS
jgi:predicted Rossmann fold flavoprotein